MWKDQSLYVAIKTMSRVNKDENMQELFDKLVNSKSEPDEDIDQLLGNFFVSVEKRHTGIERFLCGLFYSKYHFEREGKSELKKIVYNPDILVNEVIKKDDKIDLQSKNILEQRYINEKNIIKPFSSESEKRKYSVARRIIWEKGELYSEQINVDIDKEINNLKKRIDNEKKLYEKNTPFYANDFEVIDFLVEFDNIFYDIKRLNNSGQFKRILYRKGLFKIIDFLDIENINEISTGTVSQQLLREIFKSGEFGLEVQKDGTITVSKNMPMINRIKNNKQLRNIFIKLYELKKLEEKKNLWLHLKQNNKNNTLTEKKQKVEEYKKQIGELNKENIIK